MTRRLNLIAVFTISVVCLLLLLSANHRFAGPNYVTEPYRSPNSNPNRFGGGGGGNNAPADWGLKRLQKELLLADQATNDLGYEQQTVRAGPPKRISEVLEEQRETLRMELDGFPLLDNKPLADFTLATGGQPIRSVVITTWRSGSTFLGDILNTLPGNFYHYEPLLDFDIVQVRDEPLASKAIRNIKHLLNCDYFEMGEYLAFGEEHTYLFKHNTRLWRQCQEHPHLCWRPRFLTPFCKLFPLQSMKVVRLRLGIAARLLEDDELNVKLVLLVRDPRGTLQSRKHREWCPGRADCDHAATLCRDMVSDYEAAQILAKTHPKRFRVVRYEDLSLEPFDGTKDLLQFYGLPFDTSVEDFLDSHTKVDYGGVSSTFRDSKSAPFHWLKDLQFEEIKTIQESCVQAMTVWGYKAIDNATSLDPKFNPLLPYSL